jgi:nicotinamide mononucleotide adenylyltransferase
MSSQPDIFDLNPRLNRMTSVGPTITKRRGLTLGERDAKITEFEKFIKNAHLINEGMNGYTVDEVLTQDESGKEANFFYFIGRLNPPHNGHIKALKQLIELANSQDSIPLILLGSGPGSLRTMDNPITFEAKKAFIESVLTGNYIIQKMTNPASDVSNYIKTNLQEPMSNIEKITINHIAGGKDEDTTKLAFALKSAENTARRFAPEADIVADVRAIDAETTDSGAAMSATKVRKDAYKTVLANTGFEGWPQQYKDFYGPNAELIYNEILFPLEEIPDSEKETVLTTYIQYGELPSTKKRKPEASKIMREETPGTRRSTRRGGRNKQYTNKRRKRHTNKRRKRHINTRRKRRNTQRKY